jgi:hypothetical protein
MIALVKRLFLKRPRPLRLTVTWMDEAVGFVLWDVSRPIPVDIGQRREVGAIRGGSYQAVLVDLLSGVSGRLEATRWILFSEALPRALESGDSTRRAPQDLLECAACLSAFELPERVLSAAALVEQGVYACHDFGPEGTGFCAPFGNRLLFIAKGNSEPFRRLSRPHFGPHRTLLDLSTDWISQTVTLYRNKTGMLLKRVRAAWKADTGKAVSAVVPVDHGWVPVDWPIGDTRPFDHGVYYVHQLAAACNGANKFRLRIPELERRRRFWAWERRLRFLAFVLMAGWIFLFVGACRQPHFAGDRPDPAILAEYHQLRSSLSQYQERWGLAEAADGARLDPILLVGRVARILPGEAGERQVSVERLEEHRRYRVRASGHLAGPTAASELDRFVGAMRGDPTQPGVDNLKFNREGNGLRFEVEAVFDASRNGAR